MVYKMKKIYLLIAYTCSSTPVMYRMLKVKTQRFFKNEFSQYSKSYLSNSRLTIQSKSHPTSPGHSTFSFVFLIIECTLYTQANVFQWKATANLTAVTIDGDRIAFR